jgi:hypothetical protein
MRRQKLVLSTVSPLNDRHRRQIRRYPQSGRSRRSGGRVPIVRTRCGLHPPYDFVTVEATKRAEGDTRLCGVRWSDGFAVERTRSDAAEAPDERCA